MMMMTVRESLLRNFTFAIIRLPTEGPLRGVGEPHPVNSSLDMTLKLVLYYLPT